MIEKKTLKQFKEIVGEDNYWDQPTDLALYAFDSSVEKPILPEVVVRPASTEEVAATCKLCNDNGHAKSQQARAPITTPSYAKQGSKTQNHQTPACAKAPPSRE